MQLGISRADALHEELMNGCGLEAGDGPEVQVPHEPQVVVYRFGE